MLLGTIEKSHLVLAVGERDLGLVAVLASKLHFRGVVTILKTTKNKTTQTKTHTVISAGAAQCRWLGSERVRSRRDTATPKKRVNVAITSGHRNDAAKILQYFVWYYEIVDRAHNVKYNNIVALIRGIRRRTRAFGGTSPEKYFVGCYC